MFVALLLLFAPAARAAGAADPTAAWATYRDRFVTADGRVVDTGNHHISHTEGQGWAMLFAESFDDRATFDRIWTWTRDNLQRHDTALFAWKWDPANTKDRVADANDASDGDIAIAWALCRAARHWHDAHYRRAARAIIDDIRRQLLDKVAGRLVLLPGLAGFDGKAGTTVNLSYYIYPAFKEFARVVPSRQWGRLRGDGLGLLAKARFGRWNLPPDWLELENDDGIAPAPEFPPRFGYDAIRIPLYLIWGKVATPQRLAPYLAFWSSAGVKPVPAWADLKTDAVAPYAGPTGFQAIAALARTYRDPDPRPLPEFGDKDDYYSASLTLLAGIAQRESRR